MNKARASLLSHSFTMLLSPLKWFDLRLTDWMKVDGRSRWHRITLCYYISINNADTRPMAVVSKLTEGRFGIAWLLEGRAFVLSSLPPEQLWPLKSTEACRNASSARFPVRLALFHLTKRLPNWLRPIFSNLFPITNETRMVDIPSTDQHYKPLPLLKILHIKQNHIKVEKIRRETTKHKPHV